MFISASRQVRQEPIPWVALREGRMLDVWPNSPCLQGRAGCQISLPVYSVFWRTRAAVMHSCLHFNVFSLAMHVVYAWPCHCPKSSIAKASPFDHTKNRCKVMYVVWLLSSPKKRALGFLPALWVITSRCFVLYNSLGTCTHWPYWHSEQERQKPAPVVGPGKVRILAAWSNSFLYSLGKSWTGGSLLIHCARVEIMLRVCLHLSYCFFFVCLFLFCGVPSPRV